jgi:carbamoyl-phosphate synthase small subunit
VLLSLQGKTPPAILALADGTVFQGQSLGASGQTVGEVVFNTSMTGYQEILTDPSYAHQLVTLTYPHIGNYGINAQDCESSQIHAQGLIIKDLPQEPSNFRSEQSLSSYLKSEGKLGICGLDTRALTRILRTKGAQNGAIVALEMGQSMTQETIAKAIELAKSAKSMAGLDLAKEVTTPKSYQFDEGEWQLTSGFSKPKGAKFKVVAFDFGVKKNILRMLVERGCEVTVVPAQTSVKEVLALKPNGIFLSNGPGDPEPCDYAIDAAKTLIDQGLPTFGICLGHQIMALASGAKTYKMKFGHHGANHPVKDLESGRVCITSQNHGFAVDATNLPANLKVTHVSLFDGSLQGLQRTDRPAFCFQGHPEASPGPHDIAYLFDRFIQLMETSTHA